MAQKVSIVDIAKKAGVSISTVSRILNGKAEEFRISEKSQLKVRETAKKLNYVPNQFAASLKSGKSNTIALIIPSLSNPFFADVASEINTEIRNRGYITIIGDSNENKELELEELQQMQARNIEALVIAPTAQNARVIKQLYDRGLPVVCIDRYLEDIDVPYVTTDNYAGAIMATKHLLENGHTRLACIQGVEDSVPNKQRIEGFKEAMRQAGLPDYVICGNEFSERNGYHETKMLLQRKQRPTAIFALSNNIAIGCIKALREENVSIPDDMSLITFDDHPFLEYFATPLTCVSQPIREICRIAIRNLFFMLANKEIKEKKILLPPQLQYRKSVKNLL
jgi:LacI family transcriptional regulator